LLRVAPVRCWSFVTLVILVFAFPARISRHSQNRGRAYALQTAAMKAIQTLNTAQVQYKSMFGRFAGSLADLGPSGADLIAADLASGEKWGYRFRLAGMPEGYVISAVPTAVEATGFRAFYSDQSLAIREGPGEAK
jgi:hypothetical protein